MFENNPCKHPTVILKDVQFVDLRAIVSFIYNGEVNIEVDRINEIIQVTIINLWIKFVLMRIFYQLACQLMHAHVHLESDTFTVTVT